MQLRNSRNRKSVDYQESQLKRCLATQKSVGQIKQKRSLSRDYEIQKSHVSTNHTNKKASEIIKLKDILKQKDFNKSEQESKELIQSNPSPFKIECRTNNSRCTNCNCKNEIAEDDLILKQEILGHLDKIHQIVQKNDRFLSHRSQLELRTDSLLKKERASIDGRMKENEQELNQDILRNSKKHNLNYIIEQQQQQISNMKSQLSSQEQMYIEKQQKYEQDIQQLKNQIMQLSNGLEKMKEHFTYNQFKKQDNSNNIHLKK
ncbi:unnamed protein product (macronuclear) [Paramecium tetraurelia]|uniref:Uncharacterized protein n=1 Tax=Paramecium tetraurelia TaxID=5888 RepID=A0DP56_PARTE|nr:uncharacterized protein GSPATT00019004001 [Paramecium tetraurelia]CAK84823.1 unnamed protein product [Paramecium tetraurelia]|eukprot:XP_001452220.1 hypothetical protein (macronuclear) [Paramecium tetraurelia strain d4-2]